MTTRSLPAALVALLLLAPAAPAAAQLSCRNRDHDRWGERYCDIQTRVIRAGGTIRVEAGPNGGVTVIGTDRNDIELRARVTANARSEARAREIAEDVEVVASGTRISATGPRTGNRESWSVSFELRVPKRSDLYLRSYNGGIDVEDVSGEMDLATENGGLSLAGLAGSVKAETTNGGVDVALEGRTWVGDGLHVRTINGGVDLTVPEGYNAELETGTRNGGLDFDFPVRVQGRLDRRIRTTLGNGGPSISVTTTNGGVSLHRR